MKTGDFLDPLPPLTDTTSESAEDSEAKRSATGATAGEAAPVYREPEDHDALPLTWESWSGLEHDLERAWMWKKGYEAECEGRLKAMLSPEARALYPYVREAMIDTIRDVDGLLLACLQRLRPGFAGAIDYLMGLDRAWLEPYEEAEERAATGDWRAPASEYEQYGHLSRNAPC